MTQLPQQLQRVVTFMQRTRLLKQFAQVKAVTQSPDNSAEH